MARIPTPIPDTAVTAVRGLFSGPVIDVLWKIGVSVVFVVFIVLLASIGGFFGPFLAATILAALLVDEIQGVVSDVWHRNFWIWRS